MTAFSPTVFYLTCLGLLSVGALLLLFVRKSDRSANLISAVFSSAAALLGLVASGAVLFGESQIAFDAGNILPGLALSVRVDRLAAFFLFVICTIALFASLYGYGYVKHYYGKYDLGKLGFFYCLFIAGLVLVTGAHNAFFFLVAWEIMSLASYFLVVFDDRDPQNVKAGTLYFIMTHAGTAFIMLAFLLLYGATGSFDFDMIRAAAGTASPALLAAVFLLAFIGFGTKAGIIPLHVWLPAAHPAAPTHVSALMSGVMIKTGVFMMIRLFLDILPLPPLWWGIVVIIVGAVSSLLGVLYALTEHDLKRLLAFHSIENIGIILLGFGSAMVFASLSLYPLAMLALAASLFHVFNHAVFKSLLFLGAGAVISSTGTRNMEEYGGLIKRMPQTAFFFLVGAMAISALPPFNGFFSEWATYQALFAGIAVGGMGVHLAFIFAAASLVFTGGLAAACFVKAFGITFLARPRSGHAEHAHEASLSERIAMAALSAIALLAGIFAGPIMEALTLTAGSVSALSAYALAFGAGGWTFGLPDGFSPVSMPLVFAVIAAGIIAAVIAVKVLARGRHVKIGRTWDCGSDLGPRMEITATGFSRSIITVFKGILKPSKQFSTEYRDADIRYFAKSSSVKLEVKDIYAAYLYGPIRRLITGIADKVKKVQGGNVNAYVSYIFVTLIIFLCLIAAK